MYLNKPFSPRLWDYELAYLRQCFLPNETKKGNLNGHKEY